MKRQIAKIIKHRVEQLPSWSSPLFPMKTWGVLLAEDGSASIVQETLSLERIPQIGNLEWELV